MQFVVTLTPGSGIGSAVIGIIGALVFLKRQHILHINTSAASVPVAIFLVNFLMPLSYIKLINVPHYVMFNKKINNYQVCTNGYTELYHTSETQENMHSALDLWCQEAIEFWKVKSPFKYIPVDCCVNIRRGDKITLEPLCLQGSVSEFAEAVKKIHANRVFHTSDDYSTFLELKQLLPMANIQTVCTENDKGYFLKTINDRNDTHTTMLHIDKFLKEMCMMINSPYFIGTQTTNVGLLVRLLRNNKNCIFLY